MVRREEEKLEKVVFQEKVEARKSCRDHQVIHRRQAEEAKWINRTGGWEREREGGEVGFSGEDRGQGDALRIARWLIEDLQEKNNGSTGG